jgi:hypothetical protein
MQNLRNALDNLERRIRSLNYNGYFTRTLHEELKGKEVLDLVLSLRLHAPDNKSNEFKFHYYGQPPIVDERTKIDINGEKLIIRELEEEVQNSYKEFKISNSQNFKTKAIDKRKAFKAYVDIPLWMKKCNEDNFFYSDKVDKCVCGESLGDTLNLRGLIRLYTNFDEDKLNEKIKSKPVTDKILYLFAQQEEPDCFRSKINLDNSQQEKSCKKCKYRFVCSPNRNKPSGKVNPVDPDEVIFQLQERCLELLGQKYKIPILLLDPDIRYFDGVNISRILKYRAVDHMEITVEDADNIISHYSSYKNKIETAAGAFDKIFFGYYESKYVENLDSMVSIVEALFEKKDFEKNARNILRKVVQETSAGITYRVWETWNSYLMKLNRSDNPVEGLSKIQNLLLTTLSVSENNLEIIRTFAEALFVKAEQVLITPLEYYGQKIGLIFTYIDIEVGEEDGHLDKIEDVFKQIATELAPDIFYSLEYEMYIEALRDLENNSVNNVPDILLSVFPRFINMVAGTFWTKKQLKADNANIPAFCRKFNTLTENAICKLDKCAEGRSCSEECAFAMGKNDISVKIFVTDEEGKKTVRYSPIVCSVKQEENSYFSAHNVKSRLLVPVKFEAEANGLEEIEGVFDIYFDLSEFVISRNASGLFREINFVYTLIANAAKQKHDVIKRGTKAAVAAIMGRNMSHNIGSHVLSYWIKYLNDYNSIKSLLKVTKDESRLMEYLRQRMDFIAEICTSNPCWNSSMMFCRDILIPFLRQRVLLNNIILSEGIHRDACNIDDCITKHHLMKFIVNIDGINELEAFWDDGKYYYSFRNNNNEKIDYEGAFFPDDNKINPVIMNIQNDIPITVPHGKVGVHAFYSIIENFIRNSAKHGGHTLSNVHKKIFEITISLNTKMEEFIECNIKDNLNSCNKEILVKFTDALNPRIEPLVDDAGELKHGNWGLKEQRICANYLRMGTTESVDAINVLPPNWSKVANNHTLIEMTCRKTCLTSLVSQTGHPEHKCLSADVNLSFYFLKPMEALIILSDINKVSNMDEMKRRGLYPIEEKIFKDYVKKGITHRFIIFEDAQIYDRCTKIIETNRCQLPIRILTIEQKDISALSIEECFEEWLKQKYEPMDSKKKYMLWRDIVFDKEKALGKYLTCSDKLKNGYSIIFDRHGNNYSELASCNGSMKKEISYYQPYKGDNPLYRLLNSFDGMDESSLTLKIYELIEACLSKVIIADERIYQKSSESWEYEKDNKIISMNVGNELLPQMGVYLVPIRDNIVKTSDIMNYFNEMNDNDFVFFVLHQGLVDKMDKNEKEDLIKCIKEMENKHDGKFSYIITSGRGLPRSNNFPHNARFIEISNLEAFINEFDKYGLVQTLYSLRRPENNESHLD